LSLGILAPDTAYASGDAVFYLLKRHILVGVPDLSINEKKALAFIKDELLLHKSPSVRDVTWHLKLKSARSGARLVNALITRGLLARRVDGKLVVR
jgi:predicted DNA-binding transcriptional regulator